MMFISCAGSSARPIKVLSYLSGVETVAHFFCAGSSVRSIGLLCDLSGTNVSVAIFFVFLDLSGVENDDIAQVGR